MFGPFKAIEENPETRKIMPYFPFPETQYAENEQTGTKNDGEFVREGKVLTQLEKAKKNWRI